MKSVTSVLTFFVLLYGSCAMACQAVDHCPFCEISAAALVECAGVEDGFILPGDNEVKDSLLAMRLHDDDGNFEQSTHALLITPEGRRGVWDIEAMVALPAGDILVLGSHSRNTRCQIKKQKSRGRMVRLRFKDASLSVVSEVTSAPIGCVGLLGEQRGVSAIRQSVCAAIDEAESHAAVAHDGRIWVGLRFPLVLAPSQEPASDKYAPLLRLKGLEVFTFDAAVLLDLDGRGSREIVRNEAYSWLKAGLPADTSEPFQLRRFGSESPAKSGGVVDTELVATLDTSYEGLVILRQTAHFFTDGDLGDSELATKC